MRVWPWVLGLLLLGSFELVRCSEDEAEAPEGAPAEAPEEGPAEAPEGAPAEAPAAAEAPTSPARASGSSSSSESRARRRDREARQAVRREAVFEDEVRREVQQRLDAAVTEGQAVPTLVHLQSVVARLLGALTRQQREERESRDLLRSALAELEKRSQKQHRDNVALHGAMLDLLKASRTPAPRAAAPRTPSGVAAPSTPGALGAAAKCKARRRERCRECPSCKKAIVGGRVVLRLDCENWKLFDAEEDDDEQKDGKKRQRSPSPSRGAPLGDKKDGDDPGPDEGMNPPEQSTVTVK